MSKTATPQPTLITLLNNVEAREFLLKGSCYSNFDLPSYFEFDGMLREVDQFLSSTQLKDCQNCKPRDLENVNYVVLNNKDGHYAWRPMQLIHPALYVDLIHKMTDATNWQTIVNRFAEFERNSIVDCVSLPLKSNSEQKDKAEQISNWWHEVEQHSIELALDYSCLCCTDITDCYGAIYTHSVAWALHTRAVAKQQRGDKTLIGNVIDNCLQDMSYGQTNGIPQGSVLMDFIAEMVLGYADLELTAAIAALQLSPFKIVRYRDDYRIFTNSTQDANQILKALTVVLSELGLKLNSGKTTCTDDIISGSIKADKLNQLRTRSYDRSLQKHLLLIHQHSQKFPNAGSVARALSLFYRRIAKVAQLGVSVKVLLSIATDIAFQNPRCYPHSAAIISKLLSFIEDANERESLVLRIRAKIERLPNTGYMQLWLQRAAIGLMDSIQFSDPLCDLVIGGSPTIWDSSWISSPILRAKLDPKKIVNQQVLAATVPVIPFSEVELFSLLES